MFKEILKMSNKFQLPGAERFSQYLEERLDGVLTAEGPEIVDRSYTGKYGRRWIVKLNGEQIGEYLTFGPKPDETDFGREFRGRIPDYINECITVTNQRKPESERMPEDSVSLVYANARFEYIDEAIIPYIKNELTAEYLEQLMKEHPLFIGRYHGAIVDTPWQRQDGHDKIPFP